MPVRRYNYTGRRRLTSEDVEIRLHDYATPLSFEVNKLSLERHNLPGDATVFVEAYRQTSWMRFPLGTVGDLSYTGNMQLGEFESPLGIRFRVKVTSVGDPRGRLLAEWDRIVPETSEVGPESLLPVRPNGDLGQEVFRVAFDDYPVLLINSRLTRWKEISIEPVFTSLVYPSALRTVLTRILLIIKHFDSEDSEDWRSQWLMFAQGLPGVDKIPFDGDEMSDEAWEEWIEQAINAFCKRNSIYDLSAQQLNYEEVSEAS